MTIATKTFRARSLTDALAQVRDELGPDAVVVRRREGLEGGVAGFFQKAVVEIEALPGGAALAAADGVIGRRSSTTTTPDRARSRRRRPSRWHPAWPVAPRPPASPPRSRPPRPSRRTAVRMAPRAGRPCARTSTPPWTPSRRRATRARRSCRSAWRRRPPSPRRPPSSPSRPSRARSTTTSHLLPAVTPGPAEHPEVQRVLGVLHRAGLSEAFAAALVGEAAVHGLPFAEGEAPARLRPFVARALARRLDVAPLRSASAVAVVGAGGAGKTAVIARLATAYAAAGRLPVAVIALRPKDGGAELARLLAPAGVPLWATDDVEGAAARIANLRRGALVLVDTPGRARARRRRPRRPVADLRRLGLDEVHFALPAVLAGEVAREMLAAARDLGADRIAVTHTDATARLGMAVELAVEAGLPISYLADSVGVRPAAAEDLAFALLP